MKKSIFACVSLVAALSFGAGAFAAKRTRRRSSGPAP